MMPEENQQVTIGSINLVMAANGKDALCSFNLLGAMAINLAIPEAVVNAFIQQWKEAKQQEQKLTHLKNDIQKSRLA
jgi:hypothetical protein